MVFTSKGSKGFNGTLSMALVFFCSMVLLISGCGGKRRAPPVIAAPSGGPPPVTRPGEINKAPRIRVLLKENFRSVSIEGSDLAPVLVIKAQGGRLHLGDGKGRVFGSGSGFRVKPLPGTLLKLNGVPYQEVIEVFINPLRQAVAVNELSLESYLRGVVPNELSSSKLSRSEAIKTLAIAARTFAFSSFGQHAIRGFDVYSDSRSQVYRGVRSEQPLSNRMIEETRGMIATYKNKPIVAFYSSTCGGLTEDYEEVFHSDPIPYLRGGATCPDSASPYHSWSEHISISRIQSKLDQLAGVGKLMRLEPVRKSRWGRTVEMRIVGSKGEKILKGPAIRSALGLRSNWIIDLTVHRDSSGYIVEIHANGKGWGHGVGLCQLGTVELARQGWNFERILKHYYKGIEVTRRW
ncbi:SpoIID/LytB domain-containing protein [Acidobacteria bacterium AH-259-D05]|nr:SpoIID/LytB domain-containing protein [Acidobacteria bacterium AH-259-D05]